MIFRRKNGGKEHPPKLSQNFISYIGWVLTLVISAIMGIQVVTDVLFHSQETYTGVITYMVLPGFLSVSVGLILLGMFLEWRRRHKKAPGEYPRLPVVDMNQTWQRKRVTIGIMLFGLLFTFGAVVTYRAYHFTESTYFCGQVCHQVMIPEYTAYQHSPHARVLCAECHIGSGANWYVKSKMSGLRQVWAVVTNSYELPIDTPVHNLRPARETCEACHWPEKFSGNFEREIWHFSPDQANTAMRYNLLLKVGGGMEQVGLGHGIHWHINPEVNVRYWARDYKRLDIPWVEVQVGDEPARIFKTDDCPDSLPPDAELRTMDCIDCHNRPSHIYRSPRQLIDFSMATGKLDSTLPYFKRYARDLLARDYETTEEAMEAIKKELEERYESHMKGPRGREQVTQNIEWLQTLYKSNFFPEQKVNWKVYPTHNSHFEFPGCFRCHDDKHKLADSEETISSDCEMCHTFLDQAEGEAAFEPVAYRGGEFIHPRNLGDIWKGRNCTECHGVATEGTETVEVETAGETAHSGGQ